ncbi:MAG TPA: hypothetical protein VFH41_09605, partial [Bradyrhizobium sp.]|nr:hypothetical protein [Bradyrhizobium sp.]
MLRLTTAIVLVLATAHAIASTSGAATDRPDIELAEDARAGSPVGSIVSAQAPAREQAAPAALAPAPERALSANPLWAIPLTALSG